MSLIISNRLFVCKRETLDFMNFSSDITKDLYNFPLEKADKPQVKKLLILILKKFPLFFLFFFYYFTSDSLNYLFLFDFIGLY
jgi:hypothetical protein